MRALTISFMYNEQEMLPYRLAYQAYHNIPIYIIDNESNDATPGIIKEWQEKRPDILIGSHRFSTNGENHLIKLQGELLKTARNLHRQSPIQWLNWCGCDLFWAVDNIRSQLNHADINGFDRIQTSAYHVIRQESEEGLLFYECNHVIKVPKVVLWARYNPNLKLNGDVMAGGWPMISQDAFYNFGFTKSKESREDTYKRRQKAWNNGLPQGLGAHYNRFAANGWNAVNATEHIGGLPILKKIFDAD